ncbi:hypothetical protein KC321_g17 [Hortaea werneckii]|nr:hypothetical protein KC321_g17 [Hortaea werneckii]
MLPKDFGRLGRLQELPPFVQNLLKVAVDIRVEEGGIAGRRAHRIVEDRTQRHTDHTDVSCCVGPVWRGSESVVQHLEHVMIVTDLLVSRGIIGVRLLDGDLIEHGIEPHVDASVALDEVLEFL